MIDMPSDGEITFADHAGRFYARRFGMAPMVGRLIGYLAVCDPREQSITELAEALLASRSAIAGAVNYLENLGLIRRSRAAGERMDRVRIDMSSSHAMGFDVSEQREAADLAREGLRLLADAPPERRAILLEWAAFADFLVGRMPVLEQEWIAHREALRAAGELPDGSTARPGGEGHDQRVGCDGDRGPGRVQVVRRPSGARQGEPGRGGGHDPGASRPERAGKTTMVRILSTLIPADSGSIRIAGHNVVTDPDGVRAVIGVTGQFSAVDNLLTGTENLQLMADLRHLGREAGRRRVAGLLEQFDLTDAADKLLSTYSGGMRRRLDLAMTLVGQPRVIFLDEPTTGLDPRSRRTMWQIIRELAAAGVTILLTTQYLDEADQLADRIAVLDQGRIVAEGTPAELKSRIPGGHVRLHFADAHLLHSASELLPAAAPDADQLVLQVPADGTVDSLRGLLDELHEARISVDRLTIHTPDLDDVFFAVTGSHVTAQLDGDPAPQGVPLS